MQKQVHENFGFQEHSVRMKKRKKDPLGARKLL